ncbi:hypothetical protein [Sporomusa aerivorans]|uniref:hypothetical protein n=1 Tax=Sporomusa aerivorans TaxID=204936 RepID=UPI00352B3B55
MIELIKIDDSGIFSLPDSVEGKVQSVYANGIEVEFAVTENGNIDITEYKGQAVITADLV